MNFRSGKILAFCIAFLVAFASGVMAEPVPGREVRWASGTIRFSISSSLVSEKSPSLAGVNDPIGAIERAASRWMATSSLRIIFQKTEALSVSPSGNLGDRISLITAAGTAENLALFPNGEKSPPAITRVFFNRLGQITEADIVLNPFVRFSDTSGDGIDFEAVLTHEIGHAVGLEHNEVPASIMNPAIYSMSAGFNGAAPALLLAEVDKAAIRGKYGPSESVPGECCGAIIGTLAFEGGIKAEADIWVEDAIGRLIAFARSQADGTFVIRGLEAGSYSIFAQAPEGGYPAARIAANRRISAGDVIQLRGRLTSRQNLPFVRYFGFNSGLSRRPIALAAGFSGQLFFAGDGIKNGESGIGFSSPEITALNDLMFQVDFDNSISAFAVPLSVNSNAVSGEFNFFVQNPDLNRVYCIGCIKIR